MIISFSKMIYNNMNQILDFHFDESDTELEGETDIDSDWEYKSDVKPLISEPEVVLNNNNNLSISQKLNHRHQQLFFQLMIIMNELI